jgi:biopolymer transport protein ExbB
MQPPFGSLLAASMLPSSLGLLLERGGPIMPLILLTTAVGYLLALERLLVWGWWRHRDRGLYRAVAWHDTETIQRLSAKVTGTPFNWLLACAGFHRHLQPVERDKAIERDILSRMPEVEARISTIGWIGGVLPVMGLLGTVSGMITTFEDLAHTTSRQILTQGLAEALWTTEIGLLGALPLLGVNHLLTRLKAGWVNRLEIALALLLDAPTVLPDPSDAGLADAETPPPENMAGSAGPPERPAVEPSPAPADARPAPAALPGGSHEV